MRSYILLPLFAPLIFSQVHNADFSSRPPADAAFSDSRSSVAGSPSSPTLPGPPRRLDRRLTITDASLGSPKMIDPLSLRHDGLSLDFRSFESNLYGLADGSNSLTLSDTKVTSLEASNYALGPLGPTSVQVPRQVHDGAPGVSTTVSDPGSRDDIVDPVVRRDVASRLTLGDHPNFSCLSSRVLNTQTSVDVPVPAAASRASQKVQRDPLDVITGSSVPACDTVTARNDNALPVAIPAVPSLPSLPSPPGLPRRGDVFVSSRSDHANIPDLPVQPPIPIPISVPRGLVVEGAVSPMVDSSVPSTSGSGIASLVRKEQRL